MVHRNYEFNLLIQTAEIERLYRGQAKYLLVNTDAGLRLQLPLQNFRRFVTSQGIKGRFCVTVDDDNKLISLQKQG